MRLAVLVLPDRSITDSMDTTAAQARVARRDDGATVVRLPRRMKASYGVVHSAAQPIAGRSAYVRRLAMGVR
jgi:hypothetical protein